MCICVEKHGKNCANEEKAYHHKRNINGIYNEKLLLICHRQLVTIRLKAFSPLGGPRCPHTQKKKKKKKLRKIENLGERKTKYLNYNPVPTPPAENSILQLSILQKEPKSNVKISFQIRILSGI